MIARLLLLTLTVCHSGCSEPTRQKKTLPRIKVIPKAPPLRVAKVVVFGEVCQQTPTKRTLYIRGGVKDTPLTLANATSLVADGDISEFEVFGPYGRRGRYSAFGLSDKAKGQAAFGSYLGADPCRVDLQSGRVSDVCQKLLGRCTLAVSEGPEVSGKVCTTDGDTMTVEVLGKSRAYRWRLNEDGTAPRWMPPASRKSCDGLGYLRGKALPIAAVDIDGDDRADVVIEMTSQGKRQWLFYRWGARGLELASKMPLPARQ